MKEEGDGRKPLCVGIESGNGHRLAVHRLDRGDGPAQRRASTLRPVGQPRDPVQRSAGRRGDATGARPVDRRECVRERWHIAATNFGDNAQALFDGHCYMHRQANFFASSSLRARRSPTARAPSTSSTSRTSTVIVRSSWPAPGRGLRRRAGHDGRPGLLVSSDYANERQAPLTGRSPEAACPVSCRRSTVATRPSTAARAGLPRDPRQLRAGGSTAPT